jgi:hypothetical protein
MSEECEICKVPFVDLHEGVCVLCYQEKCEQLQQENKRYETVINEAIIYIIASDDSTTIKGRNMIKKLQKALEKGENMSDILPSICVVSIHPEKYLSLIWLGNILIGENQK